VVLEVEGKYSLRVGATPLWALLFDRWDLIRICSWFNDRLAIQDITNDITSKYVPPHVNIFSRFGGLVLTCFILQAGTGFALTFYYRPTVTDALESVRAVMVEVHSGWLIRSSHRWGCITHDSVPTAARV